MNKTDGDIDFSGCSFTIIWEMPGMYYSSLKLVENLSIFEALDFSLSFPLKHWLEYVWKPSIENFSTTVAD